MDLECSCRDAVVLARNQWKGSRHDKIRFQALADGFIEMQGASGACSSMLATTQQVPDTADFTRRIKWDCWLGSGYGWLVPSNPVSDAESRRAAYVAIVD